MVNDKPKQLEPKRVFKFEKSFWKLWSNRTGYQLRYFYALLFGLTFACSGIMYDGWQNNLKLVARVKWIKDRVLNPEATEFSKLDVEPKPYKPER